MFLGASTAATANIEPGIVNLGSPGAPWVPFHNLVQDALADDMARVREHCMGVCGFYPTDNGDFFDCFMDFLVAFSATCLNMAMCPAPAGGDRAQWRDDGALVVYHDAILESSRVAEHHLFGVPARQIVESYMLKAGFESARHNDRACMTARWERAH